jgi:hypothetical protein
VKVLDASFVSSMEKPARSLTPSGINASVTAALLGAVVIPHHVRIALTAIAMLSQQMSLVNLLTT